MPDSFTILDDLWGSITPIYMTNHLQAMRCSSLLVSAILLVSGISGCISQKPAERHAWTVMVYMAGDSSLSSFVDTNLDEMKKVGSSGELKIVVLADRLGEGNSNLYLVKKNELTDLTLKEIWIKRPNEVETGRPETLTSFLNFSMKHYPADHRMLVIWGHGNGWKGAAGDGEDMLSLPDMKRALSGFKMDIVAFDACSMATMESYFELGDVTRYLVGSEKTVPTAGWPYGEILKKMPGKPPLEAGKMIVAEYLKAYEAKTKDPEKFSVVMSLLKTGTGLSDAFAGYANGNRTLDDSAALRFEQREFADLLSVVPDGNVSKMVNRTVVKLGRWNNPSGSMNVSRACGQAVYCPESGFDEAYNGTILAKSTGWNEMIYRSGR